MKLNTMRNRVSMNLWDLRRVGNVKMAALVVVAVLGCWRGARAEAPVLQPLTAILHDMEGSPLELVRAMASDSASNDGPRFRSAPPVAPHHENFEGDWTPREEEARLAIFSDDGASVWIDGERVWARKDVAQALPKLNESLHALPMSFVKGRTYRVRVEYSNTKYLGAADIDGCTLFAYTGAPSGGGGGTDPGTAPKQDVGALQISLNHGATWRDTTPGEVVQAEQWAVVGVRALKKHDSLPWPDEPEMKPSWQAQGQMHLGDTVWIHCPAVADVPISAQCENTLSLTIRVSPESGS